MTVPRPFLKGTKGKLLPSRARPFSITILYKSDGYTAVHADNLEHHDVYNALRAELSNAHILITSFRTVPKFDDLAPEAAIEELSLLNVKAEIIEGSEFIIIAPAYVERFFGAAGLNPLAQMSFAMLKDTISAKDLDIYGVEKGQSIGASNLGPIAYADSFGPEGSICLRDSDQVKKLVNFAFSKEFQKLPAISLEEADFAEALGIYLENHAATYRIFAGKNRHASENVPCIVRRDIANLNSEIFLLDDGKWVSQGVSKISKYERLIIRSKGPALAIIVAPIALILTLLFGLVYGVASIFKFFRQKPA